MYPNLNDDHFSKLVVALANDCASQADLDDSELYEKRYKTIFINTNTKHVNIYAHQLIEKLVISYNRAIAELIARDK